MKTIATLAMVLLLAAPGWADSPARLLLPPGARAGERLAAAPAGAAPPTHRRSRAREGAVVGAVVLGAGGALLGIEVCYHGEEGASCRHPQHVAAFTIVGAAVGAGLGALIGMAIKK
jgi:hypothetical protein